MEITAFTKGNDYLQKDCQITFTLVIYQEEINNDILQKMQNLTNDTHQPFVMGGGEPNKFELTQTQLNKYFGISKDVLTQMLVNKGLSNEYITALIQ